MCSFSWEAFLSQNSGHYQNNLKGYLKIIKLSLKQKQCNFKAMEDEL